ncbi:MAG TPA: hypothetical protein VES67_11685 [Vicinamibacterales bacterium]|nr:hypothetical protein [Vicinamibacterales bacterium]
MDGVYLPRRHPGILFADGGGLKSYWLAYALGQLNRRGFRVGFFDWELSGEDHRDRLERLFGADMPDIKYVRCDRPLVYEVDRLKRIREEEQLDYLGFDSVTFACDGPPEAAEVAAAYFRAVRQMGVIGSLHVAHITKADGGDQKPFGSAFWHNGARSTWFAKRTDDGVMEQTVTLGIFPRKANLGPRRPAVGVEFAFGAERTIIRATSLADVQDLASQLPIRQRMAHLLRSGAMSTKVLAEELSEKLDTVERTARRYKNQFVLVKGHDGSSRLGLLESRPA